MTGEHVKTFVNGTVGVIGTVFASVEPEKAAAIFAGVMTGLWMLRQLWLSFQKKS